jgi:hypothetical protein
MQQAPERFWSAEKHAGLCRAVDLADALENHVPVGPAKVGGRAQTCDGVLLCVGVVDHDVGCVLGADFGGEILEDALVCSEED